LAANKQSAGSLYAHEVGLKGVVTENLEKGDLPLPAAKMLYWDRNKKPSYIAGTVLLHYNRALFCRGSFVWPPLYWWEETMNEEENKIRKKRRRRRNTEEKNVNEIG